MTLKTSVGPVERAAHIITSQSSAVPIHLLSYVPAFPEKVPDPFNSREGDRITGHWQIADRLAIFRQLQQAAK